MGTRGDELAAPEIDDFKIPNLGARGFESAGHAIDNARAANAGQMV